MRKDIDELGEIGKRSGQAKKILPLQQLDTSAGETQEFAREFQLKMA
jgi:hypothetical protein